jgi:hypothetical protein
VIERGYRKDGGMAAEQGPIRTTTIETTTTDACMLFLIALEALAIGDKYIQMLSKFLDFLG